MHLGYHFFKHLFWRRLSFAHWAGYSIVELTGFIRKSEVTLGRIKHFFWSYLQLYFWKSSCIPIGAEGVNQSSLCIMFAAGTWIFSSSVESVLQQDTHTALQRGGKLIFGMPWSTIFGVHESWCTEKPFCESGLKCTLWNLNCQNPWLFTHTLKINLPGFANFIDEWSQCDFCFTNFGVILEYLESSITLSSTWSSHVYVVGQFVL